MKNGSTPEAQPFANPLSPPAESRKKVMNEELKIQ